MWKFKPYTRVCVVLVTAGLGLDLEIKETENSFPFFACYYINNQKTRDGIRRYNRWTKMLSLKSEFFVTETVNFLY